MFIIENYSLAVVFCFITMLCWGSWGKTQKLAGSRVWRYELYYWDYVICVLLLSLLAAFTMGSVGELGRGFVDDLLQADASNLASALIGGVIFNLSNILLSASVSIAGMSVAIFGSILNLYTGFGEISQEKLKLIRTLGGGKKEELLKIVLPSSVPLILANMKVNIGLCLVGVIIGEFIGARQGLGYLIIYGSQTFQ